MEVHASTCYCAGRKAADGAYEGARERESGLGDGGRQLAGSWRQAGGRQAVGRGSCHGEKLWERGGGTVGGAAGVMYSTARPGSGGCVGSAAQGRAQWEQPL